MRKAPGFYCPHCDTAYNVVTTTAPFDPSDDKATCDDRDGVMAMWTTEVRPVFTKRQVYKTLPSRS